MISDLVGSLPVNEQHFLSQVFPIDVNESVHHYKITIPAETVPSYVVGPRCSVFGVGDASEFVDKLSNCTCDGSSSSTYVREDS